MKPCKRVCVGLTKRWGIEIPRRVINTSGVPTKFTDWLTVDDPRRAIQIPMSVVEAGYEPNPRKTTDESKIVSIKCMED